MLVPFLTFFISSNLRTVSFLVLIPTSPLFFFLYTPPGHLCGSRSSAGHRRHADECDLVWAQSAVGECGQLYTGATCASELREETEIRPQRRPLGMLCARVTFWVGSWWSFVGTEEMGMCLRGHVVMSGGISDGASGQGLGE